MAPSVQPIVIRIDHREMGSGVPEALQATEGVSVQVEQLPLADYVLSPRVAVERKTAADFAASIIDRRLFSQAEALRQSYELVVYLVVGPELFEVSNLHPNAIRGALSYLIILGGISVLQCADAEEAAALLATMARHEQQGLGYEISLHLKRKAPSPELQMRYLVEDLPGIGPRTAHALLEAFGSLRDLFAADEAALRRVPGIGPKRARDIYRLLTARYPHSQ
ncbi:MAG TPA: endonuclease [Chloroflexi bacterium]|jgi:ERCC4-type nuclease|nr:endonuclease [Chloroflexota bacterium]